MPDFNEDLLQFIWKHRLLKPGPYRSVSGQQVEVLKPGELNRDSGPDFFNGQVRVEGVLLAGNIEVHLRTSDWLKHGHQEDRAYNKLILHVVYEHDKDLEQNLHHGVEVLALRDYIDQATLDTYRSFTAEAETLPCGPQLKRVNGLHFVSWLERMLVERLEEKVKRLDSLFKESGGDYVQTFYVSLLRNFGFRVNALPFEMLAQRLPAQLLLKHSNNLMQMEAMLLGMAGFLETPVADKYVALLQNEFEFLRNKYKLVPLQKELFKYSKLRPANFPDLRLVQFAALIHAQPGIFSSPRCALEYKHLMELLQTKVSDHWRKHYAVGGDDAKKSGAGAGKTSLEGMIINSFAPFYFFYGSKMHQPEYRQTALALLAACAPEQNYKTRIFSAQKAGIRSAAESQGIIQLYDQYCTHKRCLACGIAASLLKPRVNS